MSQNEKLGIEINIDLGKAKEQIDRLNGLLAKLGQSPDAAQKSLEKLTARIEALGKATGLAPERVKSLMKAFEDSSSFEKFFKNLGKFGEGTEKVLNAEKVMIRQRNKDLETAGNERMVLIRRQNQQELEERRRTIQMLKAQSLDDTRKIQISAASGPADGMLSTRAAFIRRQQEDLGKQVLDIQKNTEKIANAEKASEKLRIKVLETAGNERLILIRRQNQQELEERKRAVQQIQAQSSQQQLSWNAAAGTQGVKYQGVQGGFVRSSVQAQNLSTDAMTRLQTEANKMNAALREAPKHVNVLDVALGKLTARIAEFYSVRAVLFAVTNQIRDAISGALDFNQSMYDIAAVSGSTDKEMAMMGDSILNIATHSKYTAKEVGNLLQILAQAGVAAKDMPTVSGVVGMFATGTNATPQQAADVFTTSMNVWDIQAEDSIRIANTLTAALNASKLEVGGLSTAFNYLASQSATFGYSLEETAGIIAAMSQAGVKASTIGTGVSQLLKDLAVPKERFKDLLKTYKISLDEVNPTIHSFADIVQVFTDKGVAAEDILARMDTRVGRSLVAAMKVGAGAFRDMTDAVTGSESAIVAYSKSMEGARAKMNVLKQSFLAVGVSISESLSGVFGPMISVITTVVQGLGTLPGQIILFAGALRVLIPVVNSLTVSMLANPLFGAYAAVALTITAVIVALGYFGSKTSETAEIFKGYNDQVLKNVEAYQQVSKAIKESRREAERNDKELAKAGELYDKLGEKAELSNSVLEKKVKITDATKIALYELQKQYPQHFDNIDLENLKYGDQLSIIRNINRERKIKDISNVNAMNKLDESIAEKQKRVAELEARAQDEPTFFGPGYIGTKNEIDQLQKDIKAEKQELERTAQMTSAGSWYYNKGQRHFNDGSPDDEKKKDKDSKLGHGTAGPKAVDMGEVLRKNQNETVKKIQEYEVKTIENTISEIQTQLTDAHKRGDAVAFKNLSGKLEQKFQELRDKKEERFVEDYWASLAQSIGAEYQDGKFVFSGDKSEDNKRNYEANKGGFLADVQKRFAAFRTDLTAEQSKNLTKMPDPKIDLLSLGADKKEKVLNFELKAFQQRAEIQKEETYTAAGIYEIEESILLKTREIGAQKVKNLEADNAAIEKWLKQNEGNEALKQKAEEYRGVLERNKETIKDQNLLLEAQGKQYDRLTDHSFWSNFKKGSGSAWSSISDTDKLSQGLGSDLTNSAFNGITGTLSNTLSTFIMPDQDAIDSIKSKINELNVQKAQIQASISSITSKGEFMTGADKTALNEQASGLEAVNASLREQEKLLDKQNNAWSRFKDGLAETMKQILKTLQEYIIKLMVVALVKKIAGVAAGSGGEGTIPAIENVGGQDIATGLAATGATGGLVGTNRIGKNPLMAFASGGLVPMMPGADPNKDSVHALLQPGEFILPASVTRKVGIGFLENLRAQKFAEGGLVGGSGNRSKGASGEIPVNLTLINVADVNSIPPQPVDANQVINIVSFDINKKGTIHRTMKLAI